VPRGIAAPLKSIERLEPFSDRDLLQHATASRTVDRHADCWRVVLSDGYPPPYDRRGAALLDLIALLGGLGAALAWGAGTICSARSSRIIGAASVVAWVMLIGLVANLAVIAVGPTPGSLGSTDIAWMLVAGVGNVSGLFLEYSALRRGKVGIVTPVISTEGAIAALLAVAGGEALGVAQAGLLAIVALGVVLAGVAPEESTSDQRKSAAFWLAVLAALLFGTSAFATGHLSASLPIGWAVLPPRLVGVAAVTIPLMMSRRLRLARSALPLVVTAGLAEVLGFVCFAVGARDSVAVAAVLGSQFAAVASVAAFVFLRERVTRLQLAGVVLIVVGVAALTAVTAG
jgi:drug/metabolite transporter (DMT)-like permease